MHDHSKKQGFQISGTLIVCQYRGDVIRTRGLYVPNVALYQAEPHPDVPPVSSA